MGLLESFAALETQVGETEGVEASATVLIQGLRGEVQTLKDQVAAGSPVTAEQLDALLARLDASEQPLAAAVAANP